MVSNIRNYECMVVPLTGWQVKNKKMWELTKGNQGFSQSKGIGNKSGNDIIQ